MTKYWLFLALVLAAQAAVPTEPGPPVVPGQNDAEWRGLFTALAAQGTVSSTFTERRWFAFKKEPVVLQGELRHAPGHGLSLRYRQPEERLVIVDEKGLLLRDAHGHAREVATDPRAPRIDAVLLSVLRFDEAALLQYFGLHAARAGRDWRLDFIPRTAELAHQLGRVVVEGEDQRVRRLEFRRSVDQRVEVLIGETRTGVVFTPEEEKRFFR